METTLLAGHTGLDEWAERAPQPFPPDWASAWGFDQYGLWADWVVCGVKTRMRWIEAGTFWMGTGEDEHGSYDEKPRHLVTISTGFWLAETACTQAWWHAVTGKNPSAFHENNGGGPQHPVEQVSWRQVQACLQQVNQEMMTSSTWQASLPTEAEWEYACRAGTSTPFWWGEDISSQQANFHGNYPYRGEKKEEYRGKTMPVHSFAANPWGLWQMHGNVLEWCADMKRDYKQELMLDPGLEQTYKPDMADDGGRVLRGGSWLDSARDARAAYRSWNWPDWRFDRFGWRVALRLRRP